MTRRVKTKRGGMFHGAMSAARSKMGTTMYHYIIPLLTQYRYYLLTKEAPKAGDHVIVPHGEKYHTLFEGIEIDKGTKESIKKLNVEELNDPPKWFDKLKTLYDKVTEGIEKKKKSKRGQIVQEQNNSFQSPDDSLTSSFILQGNSFGAGPSPAQVPSSKSPFAHTPKLLTNPHFQSPSNRNGNSIGDLTSPPRLNLDKKTPQPGDPNDLYIQGITIEKRLFPNDENTTPPASPANFSSPPRLPSKSRVPLSHFSPSRRLALG
jgi:hypothetical protein